MAERQKRPPQGLEPTTLRSLGKNAATKPLVKATILYYSPGIFGDKLAQMKCLRWMDYGLS